MNTDKIYAESLANEYAPKDAAKVAALRKLDMHHTCYMFFVINSAKKLLFH